MKPTITDISGIGPAAAEALGKIRIKSVAGLARASVEKVTTIPGFSVARATRAIAAANALLGSPEPAQEAPPAQAEPEVAVAAKEEKKKGKKKDKAKKKDKGKKKDKAKKKGKGKS